MAIQANLSAVGQNRRLLLPRLGVGTTGPLTSFLARPDNAGTSRLRSVFESRISRKMFGGIHTLMMLILGAGVFEGCADEVPVARFKDVTVEAGIQFVHVNGAYGDKLLPETMGGGVAFFDFDNDGHQDLLFLPQQ